MLEMKCHTRNRIEDVGQIRLRKSQEEPQLCHGQNEAPDVSAETINR